MLWLIIILALIIAGFVYYLCDRERWPREQHPSYFASQRTSRFTDMN